MRSVKLSTSVLIALAVSSLCPPPAVFAEETQVVRMPGGTYSNAPSLLPSYVQGAIGELWTILIPEPAVGDVNEDGADDLLLPILVTSTQDGEAVGLDGILLLCLSDGEGAFAEIKQLAIGVAPSDVDLADINKDGHLDAVAVCTSPSRLLVMLGDGNGLFVPMDGPALESVPFGLEIEDVDEDGIPDVVVISDHGPEAPLVREILVFPGQRTGELGSPQRTLIPEDHLLMHGKAWRFRIADFSGDGHLDAAVVGTVLSGGSGILVAYGDGTGRFDHEFRTRGLDFYVRSTTVQDFDGDGLADLALSHLHDGEEMRAHPETYSKSSHGSVFFGGSGFLDESIEAELGITALCLLSGGSNSDLISVGRNGVLSVTGCTPDRRFGAPKLFSCGGAPVWTCFLGDVDGDGLTDVGVQLVESGLYIGFGESEMGFAPRWFSPPVATSTPEFESLGNVVEDLNGDGIADLVGIGTSRPVLAYGDGTGAFPMIEQLSAGPGTVFGAAAADLDSDGWTDLVFATTNDDESLVLALSRQGLGFDMVRFGESAPLDVSALVSTDLDGDGHNEVVAAGDGNQLWDVRYSQESNGDTGQLRLLYEARSSDVITDLVAADLDNDGRTDIACGTIAEGHHVVVVLQGARENAFVESGRLPGSLREIVDLNSDGILDISTSQGIFFGMGDFGYEVRELGRDVYSARDLDLDGHPELLSAFGRTLVVSRGNQDGTWLPKTGFAITNADAALHDPIPIYGDFNGDSYPDVAFHAGTDIVVLLNEMGQGTP